MLPDDFVCRVAFDALRPRVPVDDHAARIQHEDRVVHHAFDQQAEAALALTQGFLRRHSLRDVAGDLSEADEATIVIVDALQDCSRVETAAVLAHTPAIALETSD